MKLKDLIKGLEMYDPESEVYIWASDPHEVAEFGVIQNGYERRILRSK